MMIYKKYRTLAINGTSLSAPVLKSLCRQKIIALPKENWERDFYKFILEWLSGTNSVSTRTSGSTGTPREIRINKDKMLASALMTIDFLNIQKGTHALLCLPCEHIAGKMMVVRAFAGCLNLIPVEPSSNPLKAVPKNGKIDFAAFVPMQADEILSNKQTARQFAQIKNVLIGGAPLSGELKQKLSRFRNNIYETYGMTETVSHVALKKLSAGNPKTASRNEYFTTLPGIMVAADYRNCLVIHAPFLSKKPIITNDLVELKDNSHFKWLGRFDNVVNSAGVKLIPELLEKKIRHLLSRRYFFTGLPHAKMGRQLTLVIEGKAFSGKKMNQLKSALSACLSKYEIPKKIIFLPAFKMTTTGKIQRKMK